MKKALLFLISAMLIMLFICPRSVNNIFADGQTDTCAHEFTVTKALTPENTCTEDTFAILTCLKCGKTEKKLLEEASGHSFGVWFTDKDGIKARQCTDCLFIEVSEEKYTPIGGSSVWDDILLLSFGMLIVVILGGIQILLYLKHRKKKK